VRRDIETHTETDKQTDRQTDRQTDKPYRYTGASFWAWVYKHQTGTANEKSVYVTDFTATNTSAFYHWPI